MNHRAAFERLGERTPSPRDALARRLGVDVRALAAFRVSLGLLLLADLFFRSRDLAAFYTDAGVLPRATLREWSPGLYRLSLHAVSGEAWVQAVLFLVAAGFALMLMLGYRTRLATAASWLLLVSLLTRNPVVLNAGDLLLQFLLLWGVFLPLGERWSVDALGGDPPRRRVASAASVALLLQVVVVYAVNAAFKLRGDSWVRGDAIRYVFSLDRLTVLLGDWLARYPDLLWLFDRFWLAMVVASPLLLVLTGRPRTLFAAAFAAMHVGMALTLRLGLFPLISVAALLPFLPSEFWDAVGRRAPDPLRLADGSGWRIRLGRFTRFVRFAGSTPPSVGPLVPTAVRRGARRTSSAAVVVLACSLLVWNAATLGYVGLPDAATSVADPAEHRWDMFAPEPPTTDGWYVVSGRLESGRRFDTFRGAPVRWDRPPDVDESYPSHRWYVYLLDLRRPGYADLRPAFANYLCRRWNHSHGDDVVGGEIYYVTQPTRLDGPEPTRRIELLTFECSVDSRAS